jgi:hypothetical protein
MMNDGLNRSMAFYGDYLGVALGGQRAYPHYIASWPNLDPDNYVNVVINPYTVPATMTAHVGIYDSGNADSACQTDGNRFVVRNARAAQGVPAAGATMDFVTGVTSLNTLSLEVVSSVNAITRTGPLEELVELFNVQTQGWEVVGTRTPTALDSTFSISVATNPQRFFESTNRTVRGRISWRAVGAVSPAVWYGRVEEFHVVAR